MARVGAGSRRPLDDSQSSTEADGFDATGSALEFLGCFRHPAPGGGYGAQEELVLGLYSRQQQQQHAVGRTNPEASSRSRESWFAFSLSLSLRC